MRLTIPDRSVYPRTRQTCLFSRKDVFVTDIAIHATECAPPRVRTTWSSRTSFWLVIAAQVLLLAASNFPTPLFPMYERQYHFGSAMVTLLFGVYVLALIPSMLTLGRITDRVGRRPALVAGVAITVISSVAF